MVDNTAFAKRLKKIQDEYELTSASFADAIGVSRASISHILSGRHRPSLSFIMSVIKKYPEVNIYWLLNGTGSFPSRAIPETNATSNRLQEPQKRNENQRTDINAKNDYSNTIRKSQSKKIQRVLIFFEDGTFESFEN